MFRLQVSKFPSFAEPGGRKRLRLEFSYSVTAQAAIGPGAGSRIRILPPHVVRWGHEHTAERLQTLLSQTAPPRSEIPPYHDDS
jgi:hypothetical protein